MLLVPLIASAAGSSRELDSLIRTLDQAISDRPRHIARKEARMADLRAQADQAQGPEAKFQMLGLLLDEYNTYNTDSALAVCAERETIALEADNREMQLQCQLSTANALSIAGMYKEALDLLQPLSIEALPRRLHNVYYHVYRTLYGLMADYSSRQKEIDLYTQLTDLYRDSLMSYIPANSVSIAIVEADNLNAKGKPAKALERLLRYLHQPEASPQELAMSAYTLSESYRMLGDIPNQKKYLTISSISDMESGTKEYISLRKLGLLLYQHGDVERAAKYLRQCMDDAQQCKARFRMVETDAEYNAVNEVYLAQLNRQRTRMNWAFGAAMVLAAMLVVAVLLLWHEMRKEHRANDLLVEANRKIAETSTLKEEYIARYMDQCSVYIEKLDRYRKTLNKIAASGTIEELRKYNKSLSRIDEEIKGFYYSFDEAFLKLFPTFVEDFNALLLPEERIEPKAKGQLNTELRIFALIRLGISDSAKIAQFLRYSLNTIYSYRTRVRNKAKGSRDALENEIMKIGVVKQE